MSQEVRSEKLKEKTDALSAAAKDLCLTMKSFGVTLEAFAEAVKNLNEAMNRKSAPEKK